MLTKGGLNARLLELSEDQFPPNAIEPAIEAFIKEYGVDRSAKSLMDKLEIALQGLYPVSLLASTNIKKDVTRIEADNQCICV